MPRLTFDDEMDAAVWLGRQLLDNGTSDRHGLTWRACEGRHDLYDGISGPAVQFPRHEITGFRSAFVCKFSHRTTRFPR